MCVCVCVCVNYVFNNTQRKNCIFFSYAQKFVN